MRVREARLSDIAILAEIAAKSYRCGFAGSQDAYQAAYEQYDYAYASAIAMVMGAVELVVVAIVLLWRSRLYTGSTGGKG